MQNTLHVVGSGEPEDAHRQTGVVRDGTVGRRVAPASAHEEQARVRSIAAYHIASLQVAWGKYEQPGRKCVRGPPIQPSQARSLATSPIHESECPIEPTPDESRASPGLRNLTPAVVVLVAGGVGQYVLIQHEPRSNTCRLGGLVDLHHGGASVALGRGTGTDGGGPLLRVHGQAACQQQRSAK